MQACAAGYASTYFTTPKPQLVIWTVAGLAAPKFKPLIFPVNGFSLSNYTLRLGVQSHCTYFLI
jgi:hypothetical protein